MLGSLSEGRLLCLSVRTTPLNTAKGTNACHADNGGPPGVLYELLVACFYYAFIAASIAEVSHSY